MLGWLMLITQLCVFGCNKNVIEWFKHVDWPKSFNTDQLEMEDAVDSFVKSNPLVAVKDSHRNLMQLESNKDFEKKRPSKEKFILIAYLVHSEAKEHCDGVVEALQKNLLNKHIQRIHLLRHEKSCITNELIPGSDKIVLHQLSEDRNMTFAEVIKFILVNFDSQTVILSRANIYFHDDLGKLRGRNKENVFVLKSNLIYTTPKKLYHETRYAFVFYSKIKKYTSEGMNFNLDSASLKDNVVLKAFERSLGMKVESRDVISTLALS